MRYGSWGTIIKASAQGSTYPAASAPIFLKPVQAFLDGTHAMHLPGSGTTLDITSVEAIATVTANAGTSPTLNLKFQGCNRLDDNSTTINATVATGDTSINFAARDGINQYGYVLIVSADYKKYEWVQTTSAATTGAGTLNVTRGVFGTTAQAFAVGDYVLFTNSWNDIPTQNATTTTLVSGATSTGSPSVQSPTIISVNSQNLNMWSIDYPIIRIIGVTGGSSTPTNTYNVTAAYRVRDAGTPGAVKL